MGKRYDKAIEEIDKVASNRKASLEEIASDLENIRDHCEIRLAAIREDMAAE